MFHGIIVQLSKIQEISTMMFTLRGLSVGANYKNLSEECKQKKEKENFAFYILFIH